MRWQYTDPTGPLQAANPSTLETENIEFVNPQAKRHPNVTTIQHWQLRDLIHAPDNNHEYYYVNGNHCSKYDTITRQETVVLDNLTFKPNSLVAGHGYVAVGGHRSQLVVKNLATGSVHTQAVGGSINNSMFLSRHDTDTRLLISNNDETVKVYSLPFLVHITDITLPVAVNYAAVSGDGRRLAVVGDSRHGWLFDVRNNGYHKTDTFNACINSAFSCAWNKTSDKFAVACQDGSVSVWDVRNTATPIATLLTEQHPQGKGACRSVKFSQSSTVDLMIFSEHESLTHVVDTRTFQKKQALRPAPLHENGQGIGGICFSPDNDKIFIAMEGGTFECDVDTAQRRRCAVGELM